MKIIVIATATKLVTNFVLFFCFAFVKINNKNQILKDHSMKTNKNVHSKSGSTRRECWVQ